MPPPKSPEKQTTTRVGPRQRLGGLLKQTAESETAQRQQEADIGEIDDADSQFVASVARALKILDAFQSGGQSLGNAELAARTGLTKPTISRLAYTLVRCGYLVFNPRHRVYDLGGRALGLGCIALSALDVGGLSRAYMQQLAEESGFTIGLGTRDRHLMVYTEVCESTALVAIRARPGLRLPMATSAMGRAYLCGISEEERSVLLDELRARASRADWQATKKAVDRALRSIEEHGFCSNIGEMQSDVNGVAAPIRTGITSRTYAINLGGPAYLLGERELLETWGPRLAEIARQIEKPLAKFSGA